MIPRLRQGDFVERKRGDENINHRAAAVTLWRLGAIIVLQATPYSFGLFQLRSEASILQSLG
jgi:hypothetical protein